MTASAKLNNIRAQILAAALPDIAFDGWRADILSKAAETAGLDPDVLTVAFPNGIDDLLACFFTFGDEKMQATLANNEYPAKIRERIAAAVRARLLADADHREALRRALAALALPGRAALATRLTYDTTDIIWRWAGDVSTDYNFYSKRTLLAGILSTTRLVFLSDQSEDFSESWAFLDRRIDNVMQFEKLKSSQMQRMQKAAGLFQGLIGGVARWRYSNHRDAASSD